MKFSVEHSIWADTIHIRMGQKDSYGKFAEATAITFVEKSPGSYSEPLMVLSIQDAQELANQLYAAGIKPEQGKSSVGQIDAIKYHLEDMRKLVFGKKINE